MKKIGPDEIRAGAKAFAEAQRAKLEELRAKPIRDGRTTREVLDRLACGLVG